MCRILLSGIVLAVLTACSATRVAISPQLPALADLPVGRSHQTAATSLELSAGDVLLSGGASWDGKILSLQEAGLSYAVIAVPEPQEYTDLCIAAPYSFHGLYVGVSDYSLGSWRWFGEPSAHAVFASVERGDYASNGQLYVALLCPDGAEFSSSVTLIFINAALHPPAGLHDIPDVPAELATAYAELETAIGNGMELYDWYQSADLRGRRAGLYYQARNNSQIIDWEIEIAGFKNQSGQLTLPLEQFCLAADADPALQQRFNGTDFATIRLNRALSPAELAWYADDILVHWPNAVCFAELNTWSSAPPP